MNIKCVFRSVLMSVVFVVLMAAPAHPWHGSGYITAVASAPPTPTTPNTLYAGTDDRGVFKSTDGGTNWNATGPTNIGITYLRIDPQAASTIYAGTRGGGILRTADGGENWEAINTGLYITDLAIDPQAPRTLYAASVSAVFKSTDGGTSWIATSLTGGGYSSILALAIVPQTETTPTTLYAGLHYLIPPDEWEGGGEWVEVYRSTDGGASWGFVPALEFWYFGVLAFDPQTPTTLYAGGYDVLYKSTDGGATWSPGLAGLPGFVLALAVDPQAPRTLYAVVGADVFKSTDGGQTWNTAETGLTDVLQAYGNFAPRVLAVDSVIPGTVYAGTGVGVFKSADGGAHWNPTTLIQHSPLYSVRLNPFRVTAGTATTGTVNLMTAAPAGGATVTLASSDPAAVVPSSVTIAAGNISANFTVSTNSVTDTTLASISATFDDAIRGAWLYVDPPVILPPASLDSVALYPPSVTGGTALTGSVSLVGAPAPAEGAVLTLSSSNTAVATVPPTVTVPAGATGANFAVLTSVVTASTSLTISGTYNGVTRSALLTVTPPPTLSSISLNPTSVTAGGISAGTVTLNIAAPVGGALVALSSSDPAIATVPAEVTVAAGVSSVTFTVSTVACTSGSVTVSGTYGGVTQSTNLTVIGPATDTVTIQQADYVAYKRQLRVGAKTTSSTATLRVYVTSTGELIGTLQNVGDGRYTGQFTWRVNPKNITVRSSRCGSATKTVTSK